jgi:hypothetical protein
MTGTTGRGLLRAVLLVDGVVFAVSAAQNFGAEIPLGLTTLRFPDPVWQAGIGEAVIALTLFGAAVTLGRRLTWTAFGLSALGIAVGLSSQRVQGPARDIHLLLVPLAVLLGVLLTWREWMLRRRRSSAPPQPPGERTGS